MSTNYWTRRRFTRRKVIIAGGTGLAAAGALALAGCGDDDDDDTPTATSTGTPSTSTATTGTATTTSTGAQPKTGGTIRLMFGGGPQEQPHEDPQLTTTGLLHVFGSGCAYSRLIKFEMGPDMPAGTKNPVGDIAESWESPERTTFIFKLRPDVKWQNIAPMNGRPLVADDIIYSYKRQQEVKVLGPNLGAIESLEAQDDSTLVIKIPAPNVDFLVSLASHYNKIVGREVVELKGHLKEGPTIGTGPWIQTEWTTGSVVKFRRNPDYYGKGIIGGGPLPYADALEIYRIPDANTGLAQWRGKQAMVLGMWGSPWTAADVAREHASSPDTYIVQASVPDGSCGASRLFTKVDRAPTDNPLVRKALLHAIDRDALIEVMTDGGGKYCADLVVPAPDWELPEDELRELLRYDPEESRALLSQAGVSNWSPDMSVGSYGRLPAGGDLMYANLLDVGITPSLRACDNVCNTDAATSGNYELHYGGQDRGLTMTQDLDNVYRTGAPSNPTGLADAELDRMIAAQKEEFDEATRRDLANRIQRRVIDISAYVTTNSQAGIQMLVHNELRDLWPMVSQDSEAYANLWVDA